MNAGPIRPAPPAHNLGPLAAEGGERGEVQRLTVTFAVEYEGPPLPAARVREIFDSTKTFGAAEDALADRLWSAVPEGEGRIVLADVREGVDVATVPVAFIEPTGPARDLTFAEAVNAVSLLAFGDRSRMTGEQIRALAHDLGALLHHVAMATGADVNEPLVAKIAALSTKEAARG